MNLFQFIENIWTTEMQSSLNNYPLKTVRETEKGEVIHMDR